MSVGLWVGSSYRHSWIASLSVTLYFVMRSLVPYVIPRAGAPPMRKLRDAGRAEGWNGYQGSGGPSYILAMLGGS